MYVSKKLFLLSLLIKEIPYSDALGGHSVYKSNPNN